MVFHGALALAATLTRCAAPAFGDSIDGNPLGRTDRNPPASVRGSPSILPPGGRSTRDSSKPRRSARS
jgi:hypothetical protein